MMHLDAHFKISWPEVPNQEDFR